MKNIQILSLRRDRDCTLLPDLRETGFGKRFVVDCNGLTGIGCASADLETVLSMLTAKGWRRDGSEAGSPEGVATVYLR